MPKPKDGKVNTTISVEDDLKARIEAQAKRLGLGWTTYFQVLARERLDDVEAAIKSRDLP